MSSRPKALHHVVDQLLDVLALGDVAGEGRGGDLVFLQVLRDAFGLVLAPGVDDGDVTALSGQRVTDALAQSAIAAGDDRDRALEIHGAFPLYALGQSYRRTGKCHQQSRVVCRSHSVR